MQIKKIKNKIELDTTVEGCLNDCLECYYMYNTEQSSLSGEMNYLFTKYTAKGNVLF